MRSNELLSDAFSRIGETVHAAVEGLSTDDLAWQPEPASNSIGWLVWHLTRVQDDHIADLAGQAQAWTAQQWVTRLALPYEHTATGYGQTADEVAAARFSPDDLLGYHDAVLAQSLDLLRGLVDGDFDRVVDDSWDPPVTLGVRLISVISDDLQHAGQAGYLRGLMGRRQSAG